MASYEIFLVMLVALMTVAAGEVYKVGDSAGWTNVGHLDYKNWAAAKTFKVGDTIKFEYNKEFQNVVRVTHKNFRACNGTAPYATLSSGAVSFTIRRTGHYYFICSLPGHCEAGQKVDIRVPKSPLPPITPLPFPPSPAPSTVPVPSPAPSTIPVPSPAPSSVPVPSPAPSSAPVPSRAPSSVPVPSKAPSTVPLPSPAHTSVPVPSPVHHSVPLPSPPAPPSVPAQQPSPASDFAPAPSPHKNGSGKYSVENWLTLVSIVFVVLGLTF